MYVLSRLRGEEARARRGFMLVAGVMMLSLAACDGGDDKDTAPDAAAPSEPAPTTQTEPAQTSQTEPAQTAQDQDMADHDMSAMPGMKMDGMDMSGMDHDMSAMPGMKMDGMDMSGMDMSGMDMSSMMDAQSYATLRDRVPNYQEYTDEQILLEMQMMGGDDWRYLSPDNKTGKVGLLVLIHGFGPTGDRIMSEAVKPLGNIFPTAMAAGMSMMASGHIQASLDRLKQAGAEQILVVPLASTKYNSLVYQWDYIFGRREHGSFLDVPQIKTDAEVIFVNPIEDHPLAYEILLDHVNEISTDPANEVVILVAHGPHWEEENQKNLEILGHLATRIEEVGGFSAVKTLTLQDDAPSAVRAANVERLRAMVTSARDEGKQALIVTNLLSARSIQWKIEKDLKGLDYKFSVKGISEHDNFTVWLREAVMSELKAQAAQ